MGAPASLEVCRGGERTGAGDPRFRRTSPLGALFASALGIRDASGMGERWSGTICKDQPGGSFA
jgi:hypothetical protein